MEKLTLHRDRFHLKCDYHDRDDAKAIPGGTWDKTRQVWSYPSAPSSLREILRYFPHVQVDDTASDVVDAFKRAAQFVRAAKDAGWEGCEPIAPMPIHNLPERADGSPGRPFDHQVLGYNIGLQLPNVALLMDMGTAKTVTMMAILGRRYLDDLIDRVVIVAPTTVVPVWPREFKLYADFPHVVEVMEGDAAKRNRKFRREAMDRFNDPNDTRLKVLVTNYEALPGIYIDLAKWIKEGKASVVGDESQMIKSPVAIRSKCMWHMGARSLYNAILTGTPVTQHPMDFWAQYRFLEPTIFGKSFTSFRNKYADMGGFEDREIVRYKNVEDFERRAHSIAFRVKKSDCLDLPGAVSVYRTCELEPKARKLYDSVANQAVGEIEESTLLDSSLKIFNDLGVEKVQAGSTTYDTSPAPMGEITVSNVLTKILRLQQIAGGFVTDDDGVTHQVSTAKFDLFTEQIGLALENDQKVVVFARFRPEVEAIDKWLTGKSIEHSLIWGDTKQGDERGFQVEEFQTNPDRKVFVAQIQTAGLGITLTAGSVGMFYSYSHNFGNYDQALARLDRAGQLNKVTNMHLMADDTNDVEVLRCLKRKRNVAEAVVDGGWRHLITGRSFVDVKEFAE